MQILFENKIAVVTGGAGGIGYAVCRELIDSGAHVVMIGANAQRLDEAMNSLGDDLKVSGVCLELSDVGAIKLAVERIVSRRGKIDVLVQCAGLMEEKDGLALEAEDWDRMMHVNSRGVFFMMQQVVAQSMQANGGSIVNIASMAGLRGMPAPMCAAHYASSKGAVVAMSMQAAVEWASLGIRVNCIAPGGVETPAAKELGLSSSVVAPVPLGRLSKPEEIANCVAFLCSDKASMITGQTIVVDGGASVVGY